MQLPGRGEGVLCHFHNRFNVVNGVHFPRYHITQLNVWNNCMEISRGSFMKIRRF